MARRSLLFKGGALRQLKRGATKSGGRNNLGRVTAFHRGGGAKRALRSIDMARRNPGLVGTVERLEYDPFRTGRIALVRWECGEGEGDASPPASPSTKGPPREAARSGGGRFPKGIHDVSRRELRSAVATICGVPVSGAGGGRGGPKVVRVDGSRRRFSSSASGRAHRGIGVVLSHEDDQHLQGSHGRSNETCSVEYTALVRKFSDILMSKPVKPLGNWVLELMMQLKSSKSGIFHHAAGHMKWYAC